MITEAVLASVHLDSIESRRSVTINVIDSRTAMRQILTAPADQRPALLRQMLLPVAEMYRYFPGEVDLVEVHHWGSGFRVDEQDERSLPALDRLADADAWGRIDAALHDAARVQREAVPDVEVPDIAVMLVLGDPADDHFMDVNLGMSANGSVSGYLWLNLWPSDENLVRIEATAVHELNHNLRYTTAPQYWDPATVTLGEQVVSEGLADAFARQLYGDLGYTRIGLESVNDNDVFDKVVAALNVTGMHNFAPYIFGDATARRFGAEPVGLPTGAGYAVGNRLVDRYLTATGHTAAEALLAESGDVIVASTA